MTAMTKNQRLLVCNCQKSMQIDGDKLAKALGLSEPVPVHSELCRAGVETFERSVSQSACVHVACTQEAPLFREIAESLAQSVPAGAGTPVEGGVELRFSNIRENAGWSEASRGSDKTNTQAKIAALLAAAGVDNQPAPAMTLSSTGICLVYGAGQDALDAAASLSSRLSVSVLLSKPDEALPPGVISQPIYSGRIRAARGHLGRFDITVDGYAPMLPSSRSELAFAMARDGASAKCDLILDLSGGKPLFNAHERRDGYIKADPNNPAAVAKALFEISDLVGEFEKPRYISYDASICAHSRSGKVGCSNCLDQCPVGAIQPDGDHVAIDAGICGGCGNCAAVCPTGAASYAMPQRADVITRAGVLIKTYLAAGGTDPVVLMHDEKHGTEMIGAMARYGRGLPDNVLPLAFGSVLQLGNDLLTATMSLGAKQIVVLAPPEHPEELAALEQQTELASAIVAGLGYDGPRFITVTERDPDAIEAALHDLSDVGDVAAHSFSVAGTNRDIARTVLTKLHEAAPAPVEVIALPKGAPYGRIEVDLAGCTLCLSCVGACPVNALADNLEKPELSFTEAACVQCGICVATCPESVITLEPRYNFATSALSPQIIKGEEPFECISCGIAFGAKSSIERVLERLKGHSMFQNEEQLKLIQMCDRCRVVALAESENDPFRGGARPKVRTTDDYLAEDAAAAQPKRKPDDFLS